MSAFPLVRLQGLPGNRQSIDPPAFWGAFGQQYRDPDAQEAPDGQQACIWMGADETAGMATCRCERNRAPRLMPHVSQPTAVLQLSWENK